MDTKRAVTSVKTDEASFGGSGLVIANLPDVILIIHGFL